MLDVVPAPVRPSRISRQRVAGIGVVWVVATAVVLIVAAEPRFGPVLLNLSRGHGVHVGDAVALVVSYTAAAALTWVLLRTPPRPPGDPAGTRTEDR